METTTATTAISEAGNSSAKESNKATSTSKETMNENQLLGRKIKNLTAYVEKTYGKGVRRMLAGMVGVCVTTKMGNERKGTCGYNTSLRRTYLTELVNATRIMKSVLALG